MRLLAGLALYLLIACASWAHGAGEISVLYMGDPYGSSPFFALEGEPGIDLTPIPSFTLATSYPGEYGGRMIRAYFPRSPGALAAFDAIILSDVRLGLLSPERVGWIAGAALEAGVGVAMIGGLDSFSGIEGNSWHESSLGPLLPVSGGEPEWGNARITWTNPGDPFIRSLPFDRIGEHGTFAGFNLVEAKPGAGVAAVIESGEARVPLLSHWEVGNGRFLAFASEWKGDTFATFCRTPEECHLRGTRWGNQFAAWEYSSDFARNIIYLVAGRDYPSDPDATHVFRSRLEEYDLMMSLALLQLGFLDSVSAPAAEIEEAILESQGMASEARRLYVSGRLAESIEALDQSLATLATIGTIATEIKDDSLLWRNAVTILLVAGVVLASLAITAGAMGGGISGRSHGAGAGD
jgi:uncharacterized membrane protein